MDRVHRGFEEALCVWSMCVVPDLLVDRVHRGFEDTIQTLMHLNALVECTNLHKEFVDGIDGICHRGL